MNTSELYLICLIVGIGFVWSGLMGSFYQMVTAQPPAFSVSYNNFFAGFTGILFCAFAGPFILMRNSLRARKIEDRPLGWLVAASAIAFMWSFCSGIVLLEVGLSVFL